MDTFALNSKRLAGAALALILATLTQGQQWITERVSVNSNGVQTQDWSSGGRASRDNRYVVFESGSSDLVPGDSHGMNNVFVKDRLTGATTQVSTSSTGVQGNGACFGPTISADGRFVAFTAHANNLVEDDTNGYSDVFVKDRLTGITKRVSISSTGAEGNGVCINATISPNGRYVGFDANSSNLVAGAGNTMSTFVHDRETGLTTCVSRSSAGVLANYSSWTPIFSFDGRYVAFSSDATNLVPDDTNRKRDIFIRDQQTGTTTRVSVSTTGNQSDGRCELSSLSDDGSVVGFASQASNLVSGDTNGAADGFVRNTRTGITTRISISSSGAEANGESWGSLVSGDGRFVVFPSDSSNLDPNDPDIKTDVYRHDLFTGSTILVSVSTAGAKGNAASYPSCISTDGSVVVFYSDANNLVADDTNGEPDVFLNVFHDFDFSFALNRAFVAGQNSVQGTITLADSWMSSISLAVYDDSSLVSTPALVTIPARALSKHFRIMVTPVVSPTPVTIFVASGTTAKSRPLILVPLVPTAIAFTPRHVTGGQSITGRVVINGVAGPNGLVLNLSDNSNFVTTPPTATVPPGGTQAVFNMTTATVTSYKYVIVTAQVAAGSKTGMFRLNP